jgi:uncharacterized protein YndB with AHSA1/START domain
VTDLTSTNEITIDAPIDEVWTAITTPDLIKRWFLGVDTETTWEVGAPIVHRGQYQGKPYEDRGVVVRFEPPHVLVHTHWSEVSGHPDAPEHQQQVTWSLAERGRGTELTITERNLPSLDGKELSERTWDLVLRNLKGLLEGGSAPPASTDAAVAR